MPDNPSSSTFAHAGPLIDAAGEIAARRGEEAYVVGGYVRDALLGRPFRDEVDISVVGDGPAFARDLAKMLGKRSDQVTVYKRFGTASFLTRGVRLEFATSRRESYRDDSRNPVVKPAPFFEDLARRDFTINAMAFPCSARAAAERHVAARRFIDEHGREAARRAGFDDPDPSALIDGFGGWDQLRERILKTPLDPDHTFRDDPLRILRAVRFAARLEFTIHPETWEGMVRNIKRLDIVSKERINDEFFKTLGEDPPSRGLLLLHECGALGMIYPEIEALAGVDRVGRHAHKDNLLHTFKVVDKVAAQTPDVALRFAALLHDIGKPRTKRFEQGIGWTFHGHEHVGERMVKSMGKRYKWGDTLTADTAHLVRLHMRPMNLQDEGVTDAAIRRLVVQAGDAIDDLLTLCRADITSGNARKVQRYLRAFDDMVERMGEIEAKDALRAFQSPIRGEEIMERTGLPQSPRVGLIKTLIEEAILDGRIPNTREGAESVFQDVVSYVLNLDEKSILAQLRALSKARAEGTAFIGADGAGLPPGPPRESPS